MNITPYPTASPEVLAGLFAERLRWSLCAETVAILYPGRMSSHGLFSWTLGPKYCLYKGTPEILQNQGLVAICVPRSQDSSQVPLCGGQVPTCHQPTPQPGLPLISCSNPFHCGPHLVHKLHFSYYYFLLRN